MLWAGGLTPPLAAADDCAMTIQTTDTPPSLTKEEAEARVALISVNRYDIDVDLTDMEDGSDFRAVSTISFNCRRPGASTFVDAVLDVVSATLNGEPVSLDAIRSGRIMLSDLQAENVLVVESVQHETTAGEWVHRVGRSVGRRGVRLDVVRAGRRPPGLGLLRPAGLEGAAPVHGACAAAVDGGQQQRRPASVEPRRDGATVDVPRHARRFRRTSR